MGTRSRFALIALAVVIAILVVAVPAQAGTVKSGSSQMTVGPSYVSHLAVQHITMAPVSPATMTVKWNSKDLMYYWFRVPMAMKSGSNTSTWSPTSGKGTFFHSGSIRIVEATSAAKHLIFRAEGIRIIALSKSSYQMSVSYKTTAGPYARVTLAASTHAPKITHSGKSYKIDGVQFYLTSAGVAAIQSVTGVALDHTAMIFDADLLPTLK
jgi:hypothetical protein